MMKVHLRFSRCSLFSLAAIACCAFAEPASAQEVPFPLGAETTLKNNFATAGLRFYQLAKPANENTKLEKNDRIVVRKAAEYFVYSTTLAKYLREPKKLHTIRQSELNNYVVIPSMVETYSKHNGPFRKMFCEELIRCMKRVFKLSYGNQEHRAAMVNTGLILPIMAKLNQAETADFCSELVAGKKTPTVVKHFAFQALQIHFANNPPKLNPFADDKKRAAVARLLSPVVDFIMHPRVPPEYELPKVQQPSTKKKNGETKEPDAEKLAEKRAAIVFGKMTDAEKDGFRFVRLQAIKALAQVRLPWVPFTKNDRNAKPYKAQAVVAYALLKVLADKDNGLTPTASIAEKIEAAKGLCLINATESGRLVFNQKNYYNPDLAIKLIGQTLLDIARDYSMDRGRTSRIKGFKPKLPWNVVSKNFLQSLKAMPARLPSPASRAHVSVLIKNAEEITNAIQAKQNTSLIALQTYVRKIAVASPLVYRGFNEYKIVIKR